LAGEFQFRHRIATPACADDAMKFADSVMYEAKPLARIAPIWADPRDNRPARDAVIQRPALSGIQQAA
jgi:hypothetical protein